MTYALDSTLQTQGQKRTKEDCVEIILIWQSTHSGGWQQPRVGGSEDILL